MLLSILDSLQISCNCKFKSSAPFTESRFHLLHAQDLTLHMVRNNKLLDTLLESLLELIDSTTGSTTFEPFPILDIEAVDVNHPYIKGTRIKFTNKWNENIQWFSGIYLKM